MGQSTGASRACEEETGQELYRLGRNGTVTLIDNNQGVDGSSPSNFFVL